MAIPYTSWFGQIQESVYKKPGFYVSSGLKAYLGGPFSAEINPVFSYVLGIEKDLDMVGNEQFLNKFYKFDINMGLAVDL